MGDYRQKFDRRHIEPHVGKRLFFTDSPSIRRGLDQIRCINLSGKPLWRVGHAVQTELMTTHIDLLGRSENVVTAIVLRAAMTFIPTFQELYSEAPIGTFDIKRRKDPLRAEVIDVQLPPLSPHMTLGIGENCIASGVTTVKAAEIARFRGAGKIVFFSWFAAADGLKLLFDSFSDVYVVLAGNRVWGLNGDAYLIDDDGRMVCGDVGDRSCNWTRVTQPALAL